MPPKADSESASRARTYASAARAADRRPARVRVLHDDGRGLVELEDDPRRGVQVEQVRERQLLALQDRRPAEAGRRRRRRIASTRPRAGADSRRSAGRGPSRATGPDARRTGRLRARPRARTSRRSAGWSPASRRSRCRRRRCGRWPCARDRTGTRGSGVVVERREHARVVRRIDDDEHVAEVLGGRAHERRPADVDFLDQRVERRGRVGRGGGKRIQVDDDEIDEADAEASEAARSSARSRRARMPP